MSKIKIFLMLSGYQLTWLMCVFGELWYNSFIPGLVCGLLFLAICFVKSDNIKKTTQIVFLISFIGYLFDTSLVFFENKSVTTETNVAWEYFISKQADLMVVDMDTCEYVDICVALRRPLPEGKWTLFVNQKGSKRDVQRVISAEGKYFSFKTVREIETFIQTELQGPL